MKASSKALFLVGGLGLAFFLVKKLSASSTTSSQTASGGILGTLFTGAKSLATKLLGGAAATAAVGTAILPSTIPLTASLASLPAAAVAPGVTAIAAGGGAAVGGTAAVAEVGVVAGGTSTAGASAASASLLAGGGIVPLAAIAVVVAVPLVKMFLGLFGKDETWEHWCIRTMGEVKGAQYIAIWNDYQKKQAADIASGAVHLQNVGKAYKEYDEQGNMI